MAEDKDKPSAGALDGEIRDLERQLQWRHEATRTHAADLGHSLRETLSSPAALLVAVGVGFAAGYYKLHRKSEPPASREARTAGAASLIGTIMQGLGMAGTLLGMLPTAREPVTAYDTSTATAPGSGQQP